MDKVFNITDSKTFRRPIFNSNPYTLMLMDTGAQTCIWYSDIKPLSEMLCSRKMYFGGMQDASGNSTKTVTVFCNVPVGDILFTGVPVMYNKSLANKHGSYFDMILGSCVLLNCDIHLSIRRRELTFQFCDSFKIDGYYNIQVLSDDEIDRYKLLHRDILHLKQTLHSEVKSLDTDTLVYADGIDIIREYLKSM